MRPCCRTPSPVSHSYIGPSIRGRTHSNFGDDDVRRRASEFSGGGDHVSVVKQRAKWGVSLGCRASHRALYSPSRTTSPITHQDPEGRAPDASHCFQPRTCCRIGASSGAGYSSAGNGSTFGMVALFNVARGGGSFQNETLCPIICVNPARQPKGRTFSLSYRDRPCAALTAEWFGCELGRLPLTEGPGRGCAAYRTVLRRWVARATNSLSTNINQILSKICSAFNRSKHNHSSERCVPGLRREATPKAECWL